MFCKAVQGIVSAHKNLFEWKLTILQKFSEPMSFSSKMVKRGRGGNVRGGDLMVGDVDVPDMNLKSTATFFLNRLCEDDKKKLLENVKALDGNTIKLGSTCSGTDIIVPVFRRTLDAINEMFGAACLCIKPKGTVQYKSF